MPTRKTVLLVGGTGRTGRRVLQQLLGRGVSVRAIVRSGSRLPADVAGHSNLTVVEAKLLSLRAEELQQHLRGCDAVISCLGHVISLKGIFEPPRDLVTRATINLCRGIEALRPPAKVNLILMSSVSVNGPDLEDKINAADLSKLETEELVRRVSVLPDRKVVVFDFDDTLYDHVEGQSSRWAAYAKSAISHLKQRSVNIAVCSRNKNSDGALNRRLRDLDSQVFNDAFFASPAFQANTGVDKWDDIQQIMAHFGVKREDHVVFYDDTEDNIEGVSAKSDVIAIPVEANGIDRGEFREGMIDLLMAASSGSGGGGSTGSCKDQCSASCPCQEGEGDCDSSADCASGLVCPPDGPGGEVCGKASSGGGGGSSTGSGNLRVRVGSRWVSVGCGGSSPKADGSGDKWQIVDRKLRNQTGVYLFCDEGWAGGRSCECSRGNSEAYHAITQADFTVASGARKYGNGLTTSLAARGPMYIFPNNGHEFCLAVGSNNVIQNKDGGDDGSDHESAHKGICNEWCFGDGCP